MSVDTVKCVFRGACALVALAFTLLGCGGGGGGGATADPPPVPDRRAALVLSEANLRNAATQATRATETVLRLAQYAANEVMVLARLGTLQVEVPCWDGASLGAKRYTLQDADGNRRVSAGDTLQVEFLRCEEPYLDGLYDRATLTIRLSRVDDAEHGAVAGLIDFGAGVSTVPLPDGFRNTWLGSVVFSRASALLEERLDISASPANDLRQHQRLPTLGNPTQVIGFEAPSMTRVLDRQTARVTVTGGLRLATDALGGRIDVGFEPSFSGFLSVLADSGAVRIAGAANTRLIVPASPGASSDTAQVALDANGDGSADSSLAVPWRVLLGGFLTSESSGPVDGSVGPVFPGYMRLLRMPTHIGIEGQGHDISRPLLFQFNRPLESGTVAYFKLLEHGQVYAQTHGIRDTLEVGPREIPVRVRVAGAAIVVEPLEQLRPGYHYRMLLSAIDNFEPGELLLLRDTTGTAIYQQPYVQFTSFDADPTLWAAMTGGGGLSVVMPGRPATLRATVPYAASLPLTYRWTQLSGPALALGSTDAPQTTLTLAEGAVSGLERAVMELTVTDAVGRRAVNRVQVQVADLRGHDTFLQFVGEAGDFVGDGRSGVYLPSAGTFRVFTGEVGLQVLYEARESSAYWQLSLSGPDGTVPAVGNYPVATGGNAPGSSGPVLMFAADGRSCGSPQATGSFQVHEIERDGAGQVTRLAIDFRQACSSGAPALRGALRLNSQVPLQP